MTAVPCPFRRVVVVIPAHNEIESLPGCLRALVTAALAVPIPVTIIVVLDDCGDGSDRHAGRYGADVHFVRIAAHNVGTARAAGFAHARTLGLTGSDCWYATSDADSLVRADWLVRQLSHASDAVLGLVTAIDWSSHSEQTVSRYQQAYYSRTGHTHDHVHGANMGFSASAYWRVGGFRGLSTGEDGDLVNRLEKSGYQIVRDPLPSVATSTRLDGRAPQGFSHHLREIAESQSGACA